MTRQFGVALIGGGRWSRMIAGVLDGCLPDDTPAVALSLNHPEGWTQWVLDNPRWEVGNSLQAVLVRPDISHVIIARRAIDHAETCLAALASGKAVLVEKPFCLTLAEAANLIAASKDANAGTALVFHFARNQTLFREACLARGPVSRILLDWADQKAEMRYGQTKSYDPSLNVVQDVLPHAWSILRPFLSSAQLDLRDVRCSEGGRNVALGLQARDISVSMRLRRETTERSRRIWVEGAGWQADLDFTVEPGRATLDGRDLPVGEGFGSPLAAELRAFLNDQLPPLVRFETAQEAIRLSVAALARMRPEQAMAIASGRDDRASAEDVQAAQYAEREIRTGGVSGDGRRPSEQAFLAWVAEQTHQSYP